MNIFYRLNNNFTTIITLTLFMYFLIVIVLKYCFLNKKNTFVHDASCSSDNILFLQKKVHEVAAVFFYFVGLLCGFFEGKLVNMQRTDSSSSAITSLLSAYGGGEEDEDAPFPVEQDYNISDEDDDTPNLTETVDTKTIVDKRPRSNTPDSNPRPAKMERKATKLVSYGADDVDDDDDPIEDDDDEEVEEVVETEAKQTKTDDESPERPEIYGINYESSLNTADASSLSRKIQNLKDSNKIKIPPEPVGQCSRALQEKIQKFDEKMKKGLDLNASIQKRKDFRNPSIYEKLILLLGIDEKGTNYPPEIYNSSIWGPDSYYDELAKTQKIEMDKREKEKKERTKVEFVVATKKSDSTEPKRKTKWDAQPSVVGGAKPNVVTTTALNPPVVSVSTSSSGTKTTVISSIGTIKKPK